MKEKGIEKKRVAGEITNEKPPGLRGGSKGEVTCKSKVSIMVYGSF